MKYMSFPRRASKNYYNIVVLRSIRTRVHYIIVMLPLQAGCQKGRKPVRGTARVHLWLMARSRGSYRSTLSARAVRFRVTLRHARAFGFRQRPVPCSVFGLNYRDTGEKKICRIFRNQQSKI